MSNSVDTMNLFGSVKHTDDNQDIQEDFTKMNSNDMLDYMALTLVRNLNAAFAFKGGYMLNQLLGSESRMTHDIDFSIMNKEYYSKVKDILIDIAEVFMEKGLITNYKVKETISPTSSGGIDMYASTGAKVLGVDVGLHNLLYGTTDYKIKIGDVTAFKVERMLSDKLLSILSRKRFRRTKDLYDFYILTSYFDVSYQELINCIQNRDNYDSSLWDNIPFSDEILIEYEKAWNKLNLTRYTDGRPLEKPQFQIVLQRFYFFAVAIKIKEVHNIWDHTLLNWRV